MAVAAKSPRAVLMLYLERRRALAGKVGELEEALPVVAEVVALAKQKKKVEKDTAQLKKRVEELDAEYLKLQQQSDELARKQEQIAKTLMELAQLVSTGGAASGREGEGEAAPSSAPAGGLRGSKGTQQPLPT